MQTLAETESHPLDTSPILGATFFFSRPNKRNSPRSVFTTIAYQLAVRYPTYRRYVTNILTTDPKIVDKSMAEQFSWFISTPFTAHHVLGGLDKSVLIILDGVDECGNEEAQRELILLIGRFSLEASMAPLIWAIASRPEPHIRTMASSPLVKGCHWELSVPVDSDQGCADVERFLHDKFQEIHGRYQSFSVSTLQWPSKVDFLSIVKAASGLFVFASAVIRFVTDEHYGNPVSQLNKVLQVILSSSSSGPNPLATLDALYTEVLSNIPSDVLPTTKYLLALSFNLQDTRPHFWLICNWLKLSQADTYGALRKLHSVIEIPPPGEVSDFTYLEVYHTSFSDFIASTTRSAQFHVRDPWKVALRGALRVLQEAHHPHDSTIDASRVKVSWVYQDGADLHWQEQLLHGSFETVFDELDTLQAYSRKDSHENAASQSIAIFEDVDYANPSNLGFPNFGSRFAFSEPPIFVALEHWGLAQSITIRSIKMNRIRSDRPVDVRLFSSAHKETVSTIPDFLNQPPEIMRLITPLCQISGWKGLVREHLSAIRRLGLPARTYLIGKGRRSIVCIVQSDKASCAWCYLIPYDCS
ncbi:hypothetical protein AN958_11784 [Leucoagaricus sp. SymC.cos]|nr:hypothetical protein AN958_11784 [Leucoagaricus sp. SymC.cos]